MTLQILTALIFLVTLGLVVSAIYFLVEAPAARRRMRERVESAKEAIAGTETQSLEADLLRSEVLSKIPALHRLLLMVPGTRKLNMFIQQAAVEMTAGMLITLALLLAWLVFLICLALSLPLLLAAMLGLISGVVPFVVIAVIRQRRFLRFEEVFPDAIDLLGRAVRAGHAFTTGLDLIAKELPSPVSDEFARAYEQQNLGLPIRDALQNLINRVPLPDVRIFVTALLIQRESGGNLAEILDNLAYVIRERFKLMRQIRVYTAQGRLSLYLLVAIPPFMGIMIYFMNREYIMRLFTDPIGHSLLIAGVIMQVVGYFVIRKIIQPKF
jgi:tight adherence protein B